MLFFFTVLHTHITPSTYTTFLHSFLNITLHFTPFSCFPLIIIQQYYIIIISNKLTTQMYNFWLHYAIWVHVILQYIHDVLNTVSYSQSKTWTCIICYSMLYNIIYYNIMYVPYYTTIEIYSLTRCILLLICL